MKENLNFGFQILQTALHVRYGDFTKLPADAVVSTDDIYLSASSGVSATIWAAAGKNALARDRRKFALPMPVGTVLVTGGEQLRTRYIFHVLLLDFQAHPDPIGLIP